MSSIESLKELVNGLHEVRAMEAFKGVNEWHSGLQKSKEKAGSLLEPETAQCPVPTAPGAGGQVL